MSKNKKKNQNIPLLNREGRLAHLALSLEPKGRTKLKRCSYCNTKLDKRAKDFCPYCGTNLTPDDFVSQVWNQKDEEMNEFYKTGIARIAAGDGQDDNVMAAGDYEDTVYRMRKKLTDLGDGPPFILRSNFDVAHGARTGNNRYYTTGVCEYDKIIEYDWIEKWEEIKMDDNRLVMIGKKGMMVQTGLLMLW